MSAKTRQLKNIAQATVSPSHWKGRAVLWSRCGISTGALEMEFEATMSKGPRTYPPERATVWSIFRTSPESLLDRTVTMCNDFSRSFPPGRLALRSYSSG
jgi:hypothetical protein